MLIYLNNFSWYLTGLLSQNQRIRLIFWCCLSSSILSSKIQWLKSKCQFRATNISYCHGSFFFFFQNYTYYPVCGRLNLCQVGKHITEPLKEKCAMNSSEKLNRKSRNRPKLEQILFSMDWSQIIRGKECWLTMEENVSYFINSA